MKITGNENNNSILKELGQRIKDTRIAMSLTQKELALKAGVSSKTIERIEMGENIKVESFFNILRVFNSLSNVDLLVAQQEIPLEFVYRNKPKRKRASTKTEVKTDWVWGDEK